MDNFGVVTSCRRSLNGSTTYLTLTLILILTLTLTLTLNFKCEEPFNDCLHEVSLRCTRQTKITSFILLFSSAPQANMKYFPFSFCLPNLLCNFNLNMVFSEGVSCVVTYGRFWHIENSLLDESILYYTYVSLFLNWINVIFKHFSHFDLVKSMQSLLQGVALQILNRFSVTYIIQV